jgi:osmotically inducible protein OsmC
MTPLYTAIVTAHGGREGKIHADDPALDLALAMPKSLGGPGGQATNPEQLFAGGYAACFESALRLVARMQKKPIEDAHITAQVTLNKSESGAFQLSVELHGKIAGRTAEEAKALMEAAHGICPYSLATKGNIDVKLVVES